MSKLNRIRALRAIPLTPTLTIPAGTVGTVVEFNPNVERAGRAWVDFDGIPQVWAVSGKDIEPCEEAV